MKLTYKVLTCTTFLFFTLSIVGCFLPDGNMNCYESGPGVTYARSLPKDRLEKLYYDMEGYSKKDNATYYSNKHMSDKHPFPMEFADLEVVRIRPAYGSIKIDGCFDHGVFLSFDGIGKFKEFDDARQIVLHWGEVDVGTQVLWSEE